MLFLTLSIFIEKAKQDKKHRQKEKNVLLNIINCFSAFKGKKNTIKTILITYCGG